MENKTRYICSKMFTDLNIKFPYESIKNCCKSNEAKISLEDIDSLGNNLLTHNKDYRERKYSMLYNNELPKGGCDTCLHTEPNSLFRSWNDWRDKVDYTNEELDNLYNNENFTYYEFVLSSNCDLKCVYCGSKDSSSWALELKEKKRESSEQWKIQAENKIIEHLKNKNYDKPNEIYFFSFSGGEPTYNIEMIDFIKKVLEYIPQNRSVISIHTNLNTKAKIFDRFLKLIDVNPDIKFTIECSFEDIGKRCEAIRTGLNWDRAMENMDKLFKKDNVEVHIAPTHNLYSIPNTLEFIKFFVDKFKYNNKFKTEGEYEGEYGKDMYSMFSHNMVQEDPLTPRAMPEKYKKDLTDSIEYCYNNGIIFYAKHLERVRELIGTNINSETSSKIAKKFEYFKRVRPKYEWEKLFPHVNEIIEETKQYE